MRKKKKNSRLIVTIIRPFTKHLFVWPLSWFCDVIFGVRVHCVCFRYHACILFVSSLCQGHRSSLNFGAGGGNISTDRTPNDLHIRGSMNQTNSWSWDGKNCQSWQRSLVDKVYTGVLCQTSIPALTWYLQTCCLAHVLFVLYYWRLLAEIKVRNDWILCQGCICPILYKISGHKSQRRCWTYSQRSAWSASCCTGPLRWH